MTRLRESTTSRTPVAAPKPMTAMSSDQPLWHLGHILDRHAESAPESTALVIGTERQPITYALLAELVTDFCDAVLGHGLRSGDVVAVQASNSIELVVALLGAARANLVVAPLDPALSSTERRARVDWVAARVILTDTPQLDPTCVGECPEWFLQFTSTSSSRSKPEMHLLATGSARVIHAVVPGLIARDAMIMFTSGTTGTPKMVPWTHDNIAASIGGVVDAYRLGPSDATVAAMPLFHGHGLIAALLATLSTGGAVVLPARGKFSAHTFWSDLATVGGTWYTAVPTIHQILLDRTPTEFRRDRIRLRFIRSCSAPLPTAVAQRMEKTFGARVLEAYGMTETTHQASSVRPWDDAHTRTHTVGTPTGLSVRIVDENGRSCAQGASGEIWLHGTGVVRGYLANTEANATTFVDGWVRTGDLGVVDGHGCVAVQGRIKEQINRGGEKISPEHVEEILLAHPDVAQAAVFGVSDALYGECVEAIIVRRDGSHLEVSDLASYCREHLAPFEIPEQITLVDKLPLTAKGSVDRAVLAKNGARNAVQTA
jgi:acyl-CoA synthetase (AMP-forming)/AMP-acid ligase II